MSIPHRSRIQSLNSRFESQQKSQEPKIDSCLRPIQTNIKRPPMKMKKPTYKLVEDKDVPTIIKDYKRRIQYKKMGFLGSVSFLRLLLLLLIVSRVLLVECIEW
jgi:hypothetical protein